MSGLDDSSSNDTVNYINCFIGDKIFKLENQRYPWSNPSVNQPSKYIESKMGINGISANYIMPVGYSEEILDREASHLWDRLHHIRKFTQGCYGEQYVKTANEMLNEEFNDLLGGLKNIWNSLLELNPQLHSLGETSNPDKLFHFIKGVTAGFIVEDIHWFANQGFSRKSSSSMGNYGTVIKALDGLCENKCLGWVPAPSTLGRILNGFKNIGKLEVESLDLEMGEQTIAR